MARIREVVGERRALISLDAETVEIAFVASTPVVEAPAGRHPIDGAGATDRSTVLDLLAGRLEVCDAILSGRLAVDGDTDGVARIMLAVEILIDASSRDPGLQALARSFRDETSTLPGGLVGSAPPAPPWYPNERPQTEDELLARFDLLPDAGT